MFQTTSIVSELFASIMDVADSVVSEGVDNVVLLTSEPAVNEGGDHVVHPTVHLAAGPTGHEGEDDAAHHSVHMTAGPSGNGGEDNAVHLSVHMAAEHVEGPINSLRDATCLIPSRSEDSLEFSPSSDASNWSDGEDVLPPPLVMRVAPQVIHQPPLPPRKRMSSTDGVFGSALSLEQLRAHVRRLEVRATIGRGRADDLSHHIRLVSDGHFYLDEDFQGLRGEVVEVAHRVRGLMALGVVLLVLDILLYVWMIIISRGRG